MWISNKHLLQQTQDVTRLSAFCRTGVGMIERRARLRKIALSCLPPERKVLNKFAQRQTSGTFVARVPLAVLSRVSSKIFLLACLTIAVLPVLADASITTTTTLSGSATAVTGNVALFVNID